jgi:hypothetical protein
LVKAGGEVALIIIKGAVKAVVVIRTGVEEGITTSKTRFDFKEGLIF